MLPMMGGRGRKRSYERELKEENKRALITLSSLPIKKRGEKRELPLIALI